MVFTEETKDALEYLLEEFWILKEKSPDKYQLIKDHEYLLRDYFLDKFHFKLIVHPYFIKLEKNPVQTEPWMGVNSFLDAKDYVLFCCLLAFVEEKSTDEQFLLSQLCEEMKLLYPDGERLSWENADHRKSLVRVVQCAEKIGLIKIVEGDTEAFYQNENNEVLYDVSVLTRYFLPSTIKDFTSFENVEDFIQKYCKEEHDFLKPQHRLYRKMFLSPAVHRHELTLDELDYVRNFHNKIGEDIEQHTNFQFELYKNEVMLTSPNRSLKLTLYPENKALSDISVHFASLVRGKVENEEVQISHDGEIHLSELDMEEWVKECKEQYGEGWSKTYRETSVSKIASELTEYLSHWKMASKDEETNTITLYSVLGRVIGQYPKNFNNPEEEVESND